jgi:hypothetical protein
MESETIQNPIEYPSGEAQFELYVPMGPARFQQWWCHQMLAYYLHDDDSADSARNYGLSKKLLKELYRKEYYETNGWDFKFRMFGVTVVELGPWVRTYHAWVGVYGDKVTIKLLRVLA